MITDRCAWTPRAPQQDVAMRYGKAALSWPFSPQRMGARLQDAAKAALQKALGGSFDGRDILKENDASYAGGGGGGNGRGFGGGGRGGGGDSAPPEPRTCLVSLHRR